MKLELKEKAKKLRLLGLPIGKIANDLGVSKSTVSIWVRGVLLTVEQKENLLKRSSANTLNRDLSRSNAFRARRLNCQNKGRQKIKNEQGLYLAGCMLYWGEGSKSRNTVKLTNADPAMLNLFKRFLIECFGVKQEDFIFTINCYTDLHSLDEIEYYWFNQLSLLKENLRKGQTNNLPKSSKNGKINKSEWGTVALMVYSTEIVQEIYGAIQEYGCFENKNWLD